MNEKFEVLSIEQMRRKYYSPSEQTPNMPLSPDEVPTALHGLIPLAERWGISDDLLRMDALRLASSGEIESLKAAIAYFDDELDSWLAGPEARHPNPTRAYIAFSCMRMAADGF